MRIPATDEETRLVAELRAAARYHDWEELGRRDFHFQGLLPLRKGSSLDEAKSVVTQTAVIHLEGYLKGVIISLITGRSPL